MLMAWISAIRCLKVVPLTSSSTSRYLRMPSRVTSCPFWRVLANFERFLQAYGYRGDRVLHVRPQSPCRRIFAIEFDPCVGKGERLVEVFNLSYSTEVHCLKVSLICLRVHAPQVLSDRLAVPPSSFTCSALAADWAISSSTAKISLIFRSYFCDQS